MPLAAPLSVISTFAITSHPSLFRRSSSPAPTTSPLPPPTVASSRKIFPAHNTSNSAPRIFPTLKPRPNSLPLAKIFSLREEKQNGRSRTPPARYENPPRSPGQRPRRSCHAIRHGLHCAISGFAHALCLGRSLVAPWPIAPHAQPADARHDRRFEPRRRIPPSLARRSQQRRHPGRNSRNVAPRRHLLWSSCRKSRFQNRRGSSFRIAALNQSPRRDVAPPSARSIAVDCPRPARSSLPLAPPAASSAPQIPYPLLPFFRSA